MALLPAMLNVTNDVAINQMDFISTAHAHADRYYIASFTNTGNIEMLN